MRTRIVIALLTTFVGASVVGCGSSKDGYIVLKVDVDNTVDRAVVTELQVTVGSITRDYPVTKALPGSVGIVTAHTGSLAVTVVGIGSNKALGQWSGTVVAKAGQTVTQNVLLACAGGDCGTIVGGDAGVDGDAGGQDADAESTSDVGEDRAGTTDDARDSGFDQPSQTDTVAIEHPADSADTTSADGHADSVDAQAPGIFLGTGRDNALTVVAGSVAMVNVYAALALDAVPGTTTLTVDSTTGFTAGQLVMIWQTAVATSQWTSGDQTAINLASANVGQYELVRIGSVTAATNTIAFATSIASTVGYHAVGTQVIGVPEYTDVTIPGTSSIVPGIPWNGSKGGVVAFLAMGTVTNAGTIQADAAGFRGGTKVLTTTPTDTGCSALDGVPSDGGYAMKGETFATNAYSMMSGGRGNLATAGGGGDCHNSGGAGGGHVGRGGGGGFSWTGDGSRAVGGIGGAAVSYDPLARLIFGGGGGAGEANNVSGSTDGGSGGGLVFIIAGSLTGLGTISANGAAGTTSSVDGAGGGGAGGAVIVRIKGTATCGAIQASGGAGGDMDPTTDTVGPGGGGGTGKVFLDAPAGTCPTTSKPGRAGLLNGTTDYGATSGI